MKATDQTVTITLPRDLVGRLLIQLGDYTDELADRVEAYAGCELYEILNADLRDMDAFFDEVNRQTN